MTESTTSSVETERILDGVTFEVVVHRYQQRPPGASGDWLVRVYAAGEHVHSLEGGVSATAGLRWAERVMREYVENFR